VNGYIRTRILDFVLAIQAEDPGAGEGTPTKPAVIEPAALAQVFHTTIVGGQAIVGNSGAASIGSGNRATGKLAGRDMSEPAQLVPLLRKLRKEAEKGAATEDDRIEAITVIDHMKKHAEGSKEKFSTEKMLKYLSVYTTLVTAASDTVPKLEQALHWLARTMGHG
jgi:hypothetical protein